MCKSVSSYLNHIEAEKEAQWDVGFILCTKYAETLEVCLRNGPVNCAEPETISIFTNFWHLSDFLEFSGNAIFVS